MNLAIAYRLAGTGWAECSVSDEDTKCDVTASYLSDALGNLVLAAFAALSGFRTISFGFDEEPGEYRWVIEAVEVDVVQIDLFEFNELWGNKPNEEGKLLFSTRCSPVVFARAVHRAATSVLEEYGENGYLEKWVEHPFPIRHLELLSEQLALPQNAG